jgi:predicted SnoaL-like aldol condensation-catalyzing enzyme
MRFLNLALAASLALATISAAGAASAAQTAQEKANEQIVRDFYQAAINDKDFDKASKFLGNRYVQHNPTAADGPEGLRGFLTFLREKFPQSKSEVKRAFAQDDYVILHVHSLREPNTRGRAIIDIFKLENGKVVEHWDVMQEEVPADKSANGHAMFPA